MISLKTIDWEIKNIDTVLFDKDGTFIDLHYFWGKMTELRAIEVIKQFNLNENALSNLCLELGYNIKTKKMLKDGITALYSRVKIIEILTSKLKNYGIETTENTIESIFDKVNEIFYENMHDYTKPIDSAISFIKELHRLNVKVGIVTSDSKESTQKTINYFNWNELFQVIVGRESTSYTKESGKPTKLALKELNANPNTTIMIGDAPMDYISAKKAEIEKTILVATGQLSIEDLKNTSKYVISSLKEIEIIK